MRNRLQKLADRIAGHVGPFGYRAFVDSGPVLERALARDAGLGWIGKHSCLIKRSAGSWFFLGEILTDLPLPVDAPASAHCGTCTRCIEVCPTGAIVEPYRVDARRCISYLTSNSRKPFPRTCARWWATASSAATTASWPVPGTSSRCAATSRLRVRNDLDRATLAALFAWDEDEFMRRTEGSAIRRTGHEGWLRNIAVALGNAPTTPEVLSGAGVAPRPRQRPGARTRGLGAGAAPEGHAGFLSSAQPAAVDAAPAARASPGR